MVDLVRIARSGPSLYDQMNSPLHGRMLNSPNVYAANQYTRDPATLLRMDRSLRPSASGPDGFTTEPGGYVPNDPILTSGWFAVIPGILEVGEYIQSFTTPSIRYDQQSRYENGKMHHYAGFMTVDDLQLSIYTDISGVAVDVASRWVRTIRDKNGIYALPSSYKKTVILFILDHNDRVIAEILYKGCWLSSWDSYTLDFTGSQILVTSLTLSVDDFEIREIESNPTVRSSPVKTVTLP